MPVEILMPALSPTMEEGKLAKWLVKEGDIIEAGDVIAEIETDKATMEFETTDGGIVAALLIAEGTAGVRINTPIATLLAEQDAARPPRGAVRKGRAGASAVRPDAARPLSGDVPERVGGGRNFVSPHARRVAADRGIDLTQVRGSGPQGRIVLADLDRADAAGRPSTTAEPDVIEPDAGTVLSPDTVAQTHADRAHTGVPIDGMRRAIATRLVQARQTIPQFDLRRDIRIDRLVTLRGEMNEHLAQRDIRLSMTDFIIRACALALRSTPCANAVWAGDRILRQHASDIAVAVAVEGGVYAPVLRDAEAKSLSSLSSEMKDLAERARARKLTPQDCQGGTLAISNLGMFGVESFDAVISPPQAAILAVGAGIRKPVVSDAGVIEVATVMSVTLGVDHRVIDGALGAQLLAAIVHNLEHPVTMLA